MIVYGNEEGVGERKTKYHSRGVHTYLDRPPEDFLLAFRCTWPEPPTSPIVACHL